MDLCRRAALKSQSALDKEEAVRGRCEERAAFKAQHREQGVFSWGGGMCEGVCVCTHWSINQFGQFNLLSPRCTNPISSLAPLA